MAYTSASSASTPRPPRSVALRTQIGPFAIVPLWVLTRVMEAERGDPAARAILVYSTLAGKYANREHRAWPKREQLAAVVGLSLPSLTRALRLLRTVGALRTTRRHQLNGAVVGLEYVIIQADPSADAAAGQDAGQEVCADSMARADLRVSTDPKGERQEVPGDSMAAPDHQVPPDPMASDHQVCTDSMADPGLRIPPDSKGPANHQVCTDSMAQEMAQHADLRVCADSMAAPSSPCRPEGGVLESGHRVCADPAIESVQTRPVQDLDLVFRSCTRTRSTEPETYLSPAAPSTGQPAGTPPAKPDTLIGAYHDAFVRRFQVKPKVAGGKDGKLLQQLARTHSEPRVRELLEWFFRTPDPFIQQTGYTVGVFSACFNKLLLSYQPPAPAEDEELAKKHAALRSEILERAERRQRELEDEARTAIASLPSTTRQRLRQAVIVEFDMYRQTMKPEEFDRAVNRGMVQFVVGRLRHAGESIGVAVARFAAEGAAA